MPAKFKPTEQLYNRQTKKTTVVHHYLKQTTKEDLLKEINSEYVKPKAKQKCLNELVRRGFTITWKAK